MPKMPATIPTAIANLLVAYFCHTINDKQRQELDDWICDSEENMKVFEACLETSLLPVIHDPERQQEFEPIAITNLN